MTRVKRGVVKHAKHKKILKLAKGYRGRRKNNIRVAMQAIDKAGQYAYRDRKICKRNFRALWILRINAAARTHGLRYSELMHLMKLSRISLNRKMLAEIAVSDSNYFTNLIMTVREAT